jgi:chromosome segregation ATPase
MALNVEQEIRDLKARLDKHDTQLAQLEGSFTFIVSQLRDIQRYMHTKFEEHDKRFDAIDAQLTKHDGELAAIKADVAGLREDLPGIVTDAVRDVMRPNG